MDGSCDQDQAGAVRQSEAASVRVHGGSQGHSCLNRVTALTLVVGTMPRCTHQGIRPRGSIPRGRCHLGQSQATDGVDAVMLETPLS